MARKSWDRRYEEDIRPEIENFDQDPFTSTQLAAESSYTPQRIGHVLSNAAENPEYDIEVVDRSPCIFSVEGNKPPEGDTASQKNDRNPILEDAYDFLEDKGQASEKRIRKLLNRNIDEDDMETRMRKNGKLFQALKEYRDVEYIDSEREFRLED